MKERRQIEIGESERDGMCRGRSSLNLPDTHIRASLVVQFELLRSRLGLTMAAARAICYHDTALAIDTARQTQRLARLSSGSQVDLCCAQVYGLE